MGGGGARRDLVTFARRPGNFAVVLDLDGKREPQWITARPDRHFFGHGLFSADGRLLYTTENDFEGERGMIGVRDATDGYRQIGEFPSGGLDPHELAVLSDGRTLVIANGGLRTHPDEPRLENDTATMQPTLAYVDSVTGELLERQVWPDPLRKLSIRHLCVGADDTVIFGCQDRGPAWELRPNVGAHRRGRPLELVALPDKLDSRVRNYIGAVAIDATREVALVSAPRGGVAIAVEIASGRYLRHYDMPKVYGVTGQGEGFLLTGTDGSLAKTQGASTALASLHQPDVAFWDDHAVAIG